jgi:hypothetical protein
MMPYQISFQCFSSELGRVMDGFNHSSHFFRIKWLAVEQGESTSFIIDGWFHAWRGKLNGSNVRISAAAPAASMQRQVWRAQVQPAVDTVPLHLMEEWGQIRMLPEINILEDLDEKPLTVNMMLVGIAVFPEEELDSLMPLPSDEEEEDGGAGAYGY